MKKTLLALIALAAILLGAISSAGASTIEILNIEAGEQNIEKQGRITFEASTILGEIRIVCNKTMRGRLKSRIVGELGLLRNEAGILEIRMSSCTGAEGFVALNTLARPAKISIIEAPRRLNGEEVPFRKGINEFEFQLRVLGIECLYRAEFRSTDSRTEPRALYTRLRLELLTERSITRVSGSSFCPTTMRLTGELVITKPSVGIGVILR